MANNLQAKSLKCGDRHSGGGIGEPATANGLQNGAAGLEISNYWDDEANPASCVSAEQIARVVDEFLVE